MGVGGREIGYLFGAFKRITNQFTGGVLTGKGMSYGGSLVRPEATGYGLVYFAREMLASQGLSFKGRRVALSGSGNVAQFAAQKVIQLGGVPVTMSDSEGYIYDPKGITKKKLDWLMTMKNERRGRISEYAKEFPEAKFIKAEKGVKDSKCAPWYAPDIDVALPCATQNEIGIAAAKALVASGVVAVAEGANMPCCPEAVDVFHKAGVLFAPGKASNAGGVATSGLEMSQNSQRLSWTRKEVDAKLDDIMVNIHKTVSETADKFGVPGNYVAGANIAGFLKVADAMLQQGLG